MKTETRILSRGRTSGGGRPEGQAARSPFPPNAKARWEAINRALLDQGYAIVSVEGVSRIVREGGENPGLKDPWSPVGRGPFLADKQTKGGSK